MCVCVLDCLVCLGCFETTVAMLWYALLNACLGICSCCHVLQHIVVLLGPALKCLSHDLAFWAVLAGTCIQIKINK